MRRRNNRNAILAAVCIFQELPSSFTHLLRACGKCIIMGFFISTASNIYVAKIQDGMCLWACDNAFILIKVTQGAQEV